MIYDSGLLDYRALRLAASAVLRRAAFSALAGSAECTAAALVRRTAGSEVPDQVHRADPGKIPVRGDCAAPSRCRCCIGIAVEGVGVEGVIVNHFGTNLDLWREPMLPANTEVDITRLHARALALHVVIEFRAEGDVVQGRDLVVQIRQGRDDARSATHLRGTALGEVRRIEIEAVGRGEWIAAVRDDGLRFRIVLVEHVPLAQRVELERKVPLLIELVVISPAEPLQIVVAPLAAIDAVADQIEAVVARVALPADGGRERGNGTGIPGHRVAGVHRIWIWIHYCPVKC